MDSSTNSHFAQELEIKAEKPGQEALQRIATGISLFGLAAGFSILGALIAIKHGQADLDGISGSSSITLVGGITAISVGTLFLVIACLYLWVSVKCSSSWHPHDEFLASSKCYLTNFLPGRT
jgi:hypothetical protein